MKITRFRLKRLALIRFCNDDKFLNTMYLLFTGWCIKSLFLYIFVWNLCAHELLELSLLAIQITLVSTIYSFITFHSFHIAWEKTTERKYIVMRCLKAWKPEYWRLHIRSFPRQRSNVYPTTQWVKAFTSQRNLRGRCVLFGSPRA
jgi:hypothetical protein